MTKAKPVLASDVLDAHALAKHNSRERARYRLIVPYAEKDEAKTYGALWDPVAKTWFTHYATDLLRRWEPLAGDPDYVKPEWISMVVTWWKNMVAGAYGEVVKDPSEQEMRQLVMFVGTLLGDGAEAKHILKSAIENWDRWAACIQAKKKLPVVPARPAISFLWAHVDGVLQDLERVRQREAADQATIDADPEKYL